MRRLMRHVTRFVYLASAVTAAYSILSVAVVERELPLAIVCILGLLIVFFRLIETYLLGEHQTASASKRPHNTAQIFVFADNVDEETFRICLLSLQKLSGSDSAVVVARHDNYVARSLSSEYGFDVVEHIQATSITSEFVLFLNGYSVLYPDALSVARRRMTESLDIVELNHSTTTAQDIVKNVHKDPTLTSHLARSLGTFDIFYYAGGPILVRQKSQLISPDKDFSLFDDLVSNIVSYQPAGTITTHPCCDCLSHNEIDHNVVARVSRYRVARRMEKRRKVPSIRRTIARMYFRLSSLRANTYILGSLTVGVSIVFGLALDSIPLVGWGAIVVMAISGRWLRRSYGDHREVLARCLDIILECEAYLHSWGAKDSSEKSRWHIRFSPAYLVFISALVMLRFLVLNDEYTFTERSHYFGVVAGILMLGVVYLATHKHMSARQRAFARRIVSISGSSSYESMWIVDLTHRGAAYISDSRLEVGDETPLVFRVPETESDQVLTVVGRVTYCGPRGDQYQVGVHFKELSFQARDELIVYCSIVYPYQQARNIVPDAGSDARKRFVRVGWMRDPLTVALTALSTAVIFALSFSFLPSVSTRSHVQHSRANIHNVDAPPRYWLDNIDAKDVSTSLFPLDTMPRPDLEVSTQILNASPNGLKQGETLRIRVEVSNVGTRAAKDGYEIRTKLGKDYDAGTVRMFITSGFSPCGFDAYLMTCNSETALSPGSRSAVEFDVVSRIAPTSPSERRVISSQVVLDGQDVKEQYSLSSVFSNNADEILPAISNGPSIGDLVFHDRNANGIRDNSEQGVAGVTVTLRQFNDLNKDGLLDPGESQALSRDTTDVNGYFGASKGTSSFMNLEANKEYSLEVSSPGEFVPAQSTQWTMLTQNDVDLSHDIALTTKPHTFSATVLDEKDEPLSGRSLRIHKWVDANGDDHIDTDELQESIASMTSDTHGRVSIPSLREDLSRTYFAIEVDEPVGLESRNFTITGRTSSLVNYRDNFRVLGDIIALKQLRYSLRPAELSGSIFLDADKDTELSRYETGFSGLVLVLVSHEQAHIYTSTTRDGTFDFPYVEPGVYLLGIYQQSIPRGYSVPSFGSSEIAPGIIGREDKAITLTPSMSVETHDIGLYPSAVRILANTRHAPTSQSLAMAAAGHAFQGEFSEIRVSDQDQHLVHVWARVVALVSTMAITFLLIARRKLFR